MPKYQHKEENGVIKLQKSNEKLTEENSKLAKKLDYITKEEMIDIIKVLTNEINQLKGVVEGDEGYLEFKFTYDNLKNKF